MSLNVRDTTDEDLPAITTLYGSEVVGGTATFELEPPTQGAMAARLAAVRGHGLPWLTAEIDGTFAGYAYASPFRPRPAYRYGVEISIYVEEAARGRGVARALLAELTDRVRTMGLRHMIAAISDSASSEASIAAHGRAGFQLVGVYRQVGWKFDRWLDVTLMQRDLKPDGSPPRAPGLRLT